MSIIASDSFNRANSAVTMGDTDSAAGGTNKTWVPNSGVWGISSNAAYTPSSDSQVTTVVESSAADTTVAVKMATAGDAGLCWRSTDDTHNWLTNGSSIFKRNGGFTQVATYAGESSGDTISVVLSGSSGILQKNGTQVASWSDAFNSTATKHGLRCTSTNLVRFDDFSIGTSSATVNGDAAIAGTGAVSATGLRVVAGDSAVTGTGTINASGSVPTSDQYLYRTSHILDGRRTRHL